MSIKDLWVIVTAYVRGWFSVRLFDMWEGKLFQSGHLHGSIKPILKNQIEVVVDLEGGFDTEKLSKELSLYIFWPIFDGPLPNLRDLKDIAWVIYSQLQAGRRVLVHCAGGVNRSSLVNGVVLRSVTQLKGRLLVDYIRSKRPGALTNPNFVKYLEGI